ncbi:MAG: calmodulin [Gammaproteobacteria bacterium]|nr:calmodulin [Gammaproteobacteria bacterium]MCP5425074.1 calmodulin [Gammaproteobacteria bacterium]
MKRILPIFALTLISGTALALGFESIDTDQNGVISPEEAANVEGLDLTTADINGDGVLSIDEYQQATEK